MPASWRNSFKLTLSTKKVCGYFGKLKFKVEYQVAFGYLIQLKKWGTLRLKHNINKDDETYRSVHQERF